MLWRGTTGKSMSLAGHRARRVADGVPVRRLRIGADRTFRRCRDYDWPVRRLSPTEVRIKAWGRVKVVQQ